MVRFKHDKVPFSTELAAEVDLDTTIACDTTDGRRTKGLKPSSAFSWTDFVGSLISIVSFLADTGSDVVVANFHYQEGNYWYFGLTVTFIVVPAIVMTVFSTIWYVADFKRTKKARLLRPSPDQWAIRAVLLILQMGPISRYVDSLIYGLKSRKKEKKEQEYYYKRMIYEDCDAAFLRLFEAFMEAAPQLVLQIYIVTKNSPHSADDLWKVVFQGFTIFTSLLSLSWALAYYHRSLRFSVPEKSNISWSGTIAQLLWYFFVIAARVLSLGLLAFVSPFSLAVFSAAHWAVMFIWILTMKTRFCETRFQEIMYDAVLGVVFIFSYLNPVDRPTRYKYTFYYIITFIENTVIMGIWYYLCTDTLLRFRLPVMLFHFLSFGTGIFIMIFYYLLLHPSGKIQVFPTNHTVESCKRKGEKQEAMSNCEC